MSSEPSEYSPDESGYVTTRTVRRSTPSYHPKSDSSDSSSRSRSVNRTPLPPVQASPTIPPESRAPKVRFTVRKSVPIPARVTFANSQPTIGESSRGGERSPHPPIVNGVPAGRGIGMTPDEARRVQQMAVELLWTRERLDQQSHILNRLSDMAEFQYRYTNRIDGMAEKARVESRRMFLCLCVGITLMVIMSFLMVCIIMRAPY